MNEDTKDLAEVMPRAVDTAFRQVSADLDDDVDPSDPPGFRRYGIDELTGFPVINGRPGSRTVTSEEIYGLLKDFP